MNQFAAVFALFALLLGGIAPASAQTAPAAPPPKYAGKLSTDPAQYIADVQLMMATTNNAVAKGTASRFQQLWASNKLTASQQARVIALSQTMLTKKFRPRPHFENLFNALVGAATTAKLTDQQVDQYLEVLGKTLDGEAITETAKFLLSSDRLLSTGYLYKSTFSTLRATGGAISFTYTPIAAPVSNLEFGAAPAPKEEELPAAPKPAAKPAAKPVAKAAPKPAAKKKKASSSGWDTADLWSSSSGGGWGKDDGWGKADDGWGAPVKKKAPAKPAPKTATTKPAAAPAAKETTPPVSVADFNQDPAPGAFQPSASYDDYMAPPARGAVIVLKDAELTMASSGDSVVLHKISGSVVPNTNRLIATSGQLTWSVNGNPVTADMAGFDFDLGKPEFTAQPVTVTYPAVLQSPVKGALSYKCTRRKPGATDSGYPRFISLTNNARIKTLGDNINYQGGISMAGNKLLSAALDGSLSSLTVSLDGKPKFRASSRAYVLGDSVISANRAAVTIFEGAKDSLSHPGVALKYNKTKQLLKLSREDGMYKNTAYTDTYHQIEIRPELLTWNLTKPTMDFAVITAKNQQTADFESREFYTNTRYQQIKSINRLHPLQMVVGYSQTHGNQKVLNVSSMAADLQTSEANLRSAMAGLARDGYVSLNAQTGEVTILPKGFHYVGSARGKKDYDHLSIKSLTGSGRNATLNLTNNELTVRGVDRFNFTADSAAVFVRPDSAIIRIQKNRNIKFGGAVETTSMKFKGKDFQFDYDGFYVDMAKIDSIVIRSQAKKNLAKGEKPPADFALTNKGNISTGRLFLNDPKNKSGLKKKGSYPSFDSKSGANVYFGKQDVLGGAYDSTLVFDIPPFKMDSLNNLAKSTAGFDGTFRSGGILPPIKTKLTIQPDGGLGFVHDAPAEGYPLYGGKGRLTNKVRLDGKGLQGDGTIKYRNGTFTSDQFVFYRDSVVTVGKTGTIAAQNTGGVSSPKMTLPTGYLMNWAVKSDSMYLTTPSSGAPVKLYADAYAFHGTALLTPKGTGGNGRLDGPQSFIKSPEMTFNADSYSGRKSTLSVKSAEANKPALTANDVSFIYDLKKGTADFEREEGSKASIDLPYSQFKTTLSGGHWDFKKKLVQLRVAKGSDSTKSYFYATGAEQHGLRFKAATGVYDLSKYTLKAGGVPYIAAADAWIVPDSGRVSILANAKIKPLKNAGVILDSLAKFHKLYKGNITVLSRNAFSGDALYSFKTARDSFAIRFASFEADSSSFFDKKGKLRKIGENDTPPGMATNATGNVDAKTKFQLAPRIGYRGDVKLNSQRRGLIFDGQVQLQFGKSTTGAEWFAFKDSIDPKNITLNLRDLKTEDGTPLVTGIFMSDASNKVYPLYVSTLPNPTDVPIFTVDGKLHYDDKRGEFTLSRNDLSDPNIYEGSALTYKDSTGQISFRGRMNFINSNKNYTMVGSGVGRANPDSARYSIDALLGFDIIMPPKAVELMGSDLAQITKNSPEAQTGTTEELYKMGEFAGSKAIEAYITRKGTTEPLSKLSPKFAHTVLLNKADLRWSEKQKAWYSVGKLGLAGVGKSSMNALIDGYVEIKRDNGADVVELYLEAEPQVWYYLRYANNVLLAKSQNEAFDGEIGARAKGDIATATNYGVFLGDYSDVDNFRSHFQRDYLGGTGKLAKRIAPPPREELPTEEKPGKKKKKSAADDAFGGATDGTADAAPAPDPTPSKKRKKDQDAFGDTPVADAPVEPAKSKKKKDKEADAGATADAPAATADFPPTEEPKKKKKDKEKEQATETPFADTPSADAPIEEPKKKKKEKEQATETPPADAPATEAPVEESKKKKKDKEKAVEAPANDTAPTDAPTEEPTKKKKKEKEKKADPDDPFGGT